MPRIIAIRAGGQSGSTKLAKAVYDYNVVYVVELDDPTQGMLTVSVTPGLPREGDTYLLGSEQDLAAVCRSRSFRQTSKLIWEVTCQYSSEFEDPEQNERNPLLRAPKRRISYERVEDYPSKDKDGKPYTNSAKEPYPASVTATPRKRPVMTITRNEALFPVAVALDYADAINADPFYGAEPDHVLLDDLQAEEAFEGDPETGILHYWVVTYKFIFDNRELGFITEELDQGSYWWENDDVGDEADKRFPTDGTGVQSSSPVLLNGSGGKLTKVQIEANEFKYNRFRKYERKFFGPLRLEF